MKTVRSVLIALACGAAIGLLLGIWSTKGPVQEGVETTDTASVSSLSEEENPVTSAYDPEQYEAYLEEAAEEKNVEAAHVDLLDVAEEAYYRVTNLNYPRHDYEAQGFQTGENGLLQYAGDSAYTSRNGIDVSEFNGEIDWVQVREAGYSFAFLRLGYRGYEGGDLFLDARFEENYAGATAAGLDVGVYFFAQALDEEEAEEEAAFVLETLAGRDLQLPIIYDPEAISFDEARTDETTGTQFSENTRIFCRAAEEGGYAAGYYANLKWEVFMMDMALLQDYAVWYAGYEPTPKTPYAFSFWQYSDQGSVPGIAEATDLDIQLLPANG